jgi:hypothetical protein
VANAAYQHAYRARRRQGLPLLGARMTARDTWRRIRQLQAERFTTAEIARRLGLKKLKLQPDAITVRRALQIRRLHRLVLREADDAPHP